MLLMKMWWRYIGGAGVEENPDQLVYSEIIDP
jgi:hypothetical protein